ncbi:MAG: FAD-dependent oxidoreductase, partial [Candidatus Bathyarchaeia archaeon]
NPESAVASTEIWLCAWCYRCQKRCNQALKLPEIFLFMRKIAAKEGNTKSFEEALHKIVHNVPLPLTTLSVCFHPERAGLNKEEVLEKAERIYQEYLKEEKMKRAQEVHEEKVAIIGSGPAGLTVAYELSLRGYGVTIFEALPEAGGMLRKCIPEHRLSKLTLQKELQHLKELGVEIRTKSAVGQDTAFSNLWREGYKAIFVGAGAHRSQELKIEGITLKGVVHALDFLCHVNFGESVEVGKNVVVIGGGNVAMDVALTALKLGAKNVTVLYRRSREEMPAIPWEVHEAEAAGAKIEFLVSPKKLLGDDGKVAGIECVHMRLEEPDESGRRKAVPIEGSEFKLDTDMVVLAIGESPDTSFLPKDVELNDDGSIWVDPFTMETSVKGVFAGGDVITGPSTVIEAVCAGKRAAESIEAYLKSLRG